MKLHTEISNFHVQIFVYVCMYVYFVPRTLSNIWASDQPWAKTLEPSCGFTVFCGVAGQYHHFKVGFQCILVLQVQLQFFVILFPLSTGPCIGSHCSS